MDASARSGWGSEGGAARNEREVAVALFASAQKPAKTLAHVALTETTNPQVSVLALMVAAITVARHSSRGTEADGIEAASGLFGALIEMAKSHAAGAVS